VPPAATLDARDPAPVAARGGDLAVEAHRSLASDERQPARHGLHEGGVLDAGAPLPATAAAVDAHAGGAEALQPAPVDERVGVAHGDHRPRHARRHEGVGAGRRAPLMGAGLERTVECRPARRVAGLTQGGRLGMGSTRRRVPPPADDTAVLDEQRPDERVRVRRATTVLGQTEGLVHEAVVVATSLVHRPASSLTHDAPKQAASGRSTTVRYVACGLLPSGL